MRKERARERETQSSQSQSQRQSTAYVFVFVILFQCVYIYMLHCARASRLSPFSYGFLLLIALHHICKPCISLRLFICIPKICVLFCCFVFFSLSVSVLLLLLCACKTWVCLIFIVNCRWCAWDVLLFLLLFLLFLLIAIQQPRECEQMLFACTFYIICFIFLSFSLAVALLPC